MSDEIIVALIGLAGSAVGAPSEYPDHLEVA